jgi:hypothetical protein
MRDFVALGEKKKRRIQIPALASAAAFLQRGAEIREKTRRLLCSEALIWIVLAIIKPRLYYREAHLVAVSRSKCRRMANLLRTVDFSSHARGIVVISPETTLNHGGARLPELNLIVAASSRFLIAGRKNGSSFNSAPNGGVHNGGLSGEREGRGIRNILVSVDFSGESEEIGRLPAPGYSSFPALPGTSGEIIIRVEGEFRRILARAQRVIKFHSLYVVSVCVCACACAHCEHVRTNKKGEQESGEWHS